MKDTKKIYASPRIEATEIKLTDVIRTSDDYVFIDSVDTSELPFIPRSSDVNGGGKIE